MFVYNYRLYDRYRQPVASLAVLADDQPGWRPDHFSLEALGCKHQLNFPIVKLLDYAEQIEQLESSKNPFALVTLAHLRTRQTQKLPQERFEAKLQLIRLLYQRGWERQQILDLFAVLDWMMRLPANLEQKLWQEIHTIEGGNMPYVTGI